MPPAQPQTLEQNATAPPMGEAAPLIPEPPDGAAWDKGELKALRAAKPKTLRRVAANLLRGRSAKAASEKARKVAIEAGASPEQIAEAVREASMKTLQRPLWHFLPEMEEEEA